MCRGHGPCCDPSHGAVVDYVCLFFLSDFGGKFHARKMGYNFTTNWIRAIESVFTLFHICAFCRLFFLYILKKYGRGLERFINFPTMLPYGRFDWRHLETEICWFFFFCLTFKFIYWLWSHSLRILAAPSFERTRKHPLLHIVETALGSMSRLRLNHRKSEI